MTLTLGIAPLASAAPATANYDVGGPTRKLLFTPFPRRVRARLGGVWIVDSDRAMLLHETDIFPVVYIPVADVATEHLTKTTHTTHCPFKGDASYWSVAAGTEVAANAVWGYETPIDGAQWLTGYVAFDWNSMDEWFDEEDEVFGHFRDPFHRVDARPTSRRVEVRIDGQVVADTTRAFVISETGFDNRYYIPPADVRTDQFVTSETTSHCPHKGDSVYWTHTPSESVDVAWSYPNPLEEAGRVAGYWSFDGDAVVVEPHGRRQ